MAQNREMECTEMMVDAAFRQDSYNAGVFYHDQNNIRVVFTETTSPYQERARVWIGFVELLGSVWR